MSASAAGVSAGYASRGDTCSRSGVAAIGEQIAAQGDEGGVGLVPDRVESAIEQCDHLATGAGTGHDDARAGLKVGVDGHRLPVEQTTQVVLLLAVAEALAIHDLVGVGEIRLVEAGQRGAV